MLILCFVYYLTFAQTSTNDPHWQLKWEDQFNNFNTSRWIKRDNFDHYCGEPQVYRTQNAYTSNGNLVLEVKNETYCCPPQFVNESQCCRQNQTGQCYKYTSGWVETTDAYKTQFGYIEARIKLPFKRIGNKSCCFFLYFGHFPVVQLMLRKLTFLKCLATNIKNRIR